MWYANFYPNYIVTFGGRQSDTNSILTPFQQPERNHVSGELSKKSVLRMQKAITWLWLFSDRKRFPYAKEKARVTFRLNFITLTLSDAQMHSDDWIKIHMLQPFLKWMNRCGAIHYVWKAEAQENGNIHFHITTNFYIHWRHIQTKWNSIQYQHGYVNNYFRKFGHYEPNSTDVHAVRNERRFVYYMTNYMTKDGTERKEHKFRKAFSFVDSPVAYELAMASVAAAGFSATKRRIEGKLWACSRELLKIKVQFNSEQECFGELLSDMVARLKGEWKKHDFCDTWRHKLISMNTPLLPELSEKFAEQFRIFNKRSKPS